MKYTSPPSTFFASNRAAFSARMKPGTMAVFHANDRLTSNADAHYRFKQNSNMYYLSGIDQEEVMLILFPDAPKESFREMLFIRETNPQIEIWEGWKYSKEEAREASGIETVHFYDQFEAVLRRLLPYIDGFYLDINEHERNSVITRSAGHRLAEKFRQELPAHQLLRAAPILTRQRMIKSDAEIEQIRQAIQITGQAFEKVIQKLKPGVCEYEIEAEILHTFLANRASRPAYETIVATGKNACVLHYVQNEAQCKAGDLVLMDFGAEYGNYCADLTRTLPVSGSFTSRQRDVYQAVYKVLRQAREMLVVGNTFETYNTEVGKAMSEALVDLGLITRQEVEEGEENGKPAYKKYYMHGTSHFLGLDTHDPGDYYAPFEAGMVFTCEPGIYIPDEELGIRLENNILITDAGPVDLMENIPIEADEIETLMKR